ncbi:MAG: LamG-like jellyroll fold domain-containing protein [Pseudomonadota bacterium]
MNYSKPWGHISLLFNVISLFLCLFLTACPSLSSNNEDNDTSSEVESLDGAYLVLTGQINLENFDNEYRSIEIANIITRNDITFPIGIPTPDITSSLKTKAKQTKNTEQIQAVPIVFITDSLGDVLYSAIAEENGNFTTYVEASKAFSIYFVVANDLCSTEIDCYIENGLASLYKTSNGKYSFIFNSSTQKSASIGELSINDYDFAVSASANDLTTSEAVSEYASDIGYAETIISHWTFNAGTGQTITDASSSSIDGTINDGALWTYDDALGSNVLSFYGTGEHVNFSPLFPTSNEINQELTIITKVNPNNFDQSEVDRSDDELSAIISKEVNNEGNTVEGYSSAIYLGLRQRETGVYSVVFRVGSLEGNSQFVSKNYLPPDAWTTIIAVYINGSAEIYINGLLDSSDICLNCGFIGSIRTDSTTPLLVGMALSYNESLGEVEKTDLYNGKISEIRMYSKALVASEVSEVLEEF